MTIDHGVAVCMICVLGLASLWLLVFDLRAHPSRLASRHAARGDLEQAAHDLRMACCGGSLGIDPEWIDRFVLLAEPGPDDLVARVASGRIRVPHPEGRITVPHPDGTVAVYRVVDRGTHYGVERVPAWSDTVAALRDRNRPTAADRRLGRA